MSRAWTVCEDCHRVLWVEDGPVCPECLAKRAEQEAEEPEPEEDDCESS